MNAAARRSDLDTDAVRRRFERAAATFDKADFVHRHTLDGLLERLEPMRQVPQHILDLGSATGAGSRRLARTYRKARIVSLDIATAMLREGRSNRSRFARVREVQGDARSLPFANGVFDLVIANLSLPWLSDPSASLTEIARVLVPEGVFAFASLGPDSLVELRRAWAATDQTPHVHAFEDMHDTGDALLRAGLRDPVLDVERMSVDYAGTESLFRDLSAVGARNALRSRAPGLTGKTQFARFEEHLLAQTAGERISVTLELVYGHAWGAGPASPPGEFSIDPASIGRRRFGA